MKPLKAICLLLVFALLLPVCGCSKSQEEKIDPQYYALGKEMLGVCESFLDGSIPLKDAKARAESINARMEELPLIPKEDPLFEETDRLQVYITHLYLSFSTTSLGDSILPLKETIVKYSPTLAEILGLGG